MQKQSAPGDDPYTLALRQALAAEIGIAVRVAHISDARSIFVSRQTKMEELRPIKVMLSPMRPADELWLIKEEHLKQAVAEAAADAQ